MKKWIICLAIIMTAATVLGGPTQAEVDAASLKYRDACVAFHKAYMKEQLAKAEMDLAYEIASNAGVEYEAALFTFSNSPVVVTPLPAVPVPAPAGSISLVRGAGPVASPAPEDVDTRQPRPTPLETKGGSTAFLAWPGGSIDLKARNANGYAMILEASLDGGPWQRTRSGTLWVDGAVDGTYTIRLVVVPIDGPTASLPTVTLVRTTANVNNQFVVTWTKQ